MKKSLLFTIIAVAVAIIVAVALIVVLQGKKPEGNATLVGYVKNAKSLKPVANATVMIGNQQAQTGNDGSFTIGNLVEGQITILVSADGYKPYSFENYQLKQGDNTIYEILLDAEQEIVQGKRDDGKIIPPPPLPGKLLDKIPDFKKFVDYSNCIVTFALGDTTQGTGSLMIFTFNNGIIKQELPTQPVANNKGMSAPEMFYTDTKMYVKAGDRQEWLSTDKPKPDPKNGPGSTPDQLPKFYYESMFKTITSKTTTVSFVDKVKLDDMEMNKYYIVNDIDNNVFDGEVYTPTSGKYKDMVLIFKGRFILGGTGDRMELHVSSIGNAPKITLPNNVKDISPPSMPQEPTIKKPGNP
jgi:hypothetical protein